MIPLRRPDGSAPVCAWPGEDAGSDISVGAEPATGLWLKPVLNPFGAAEKLGVDLVAELRHDPEGAAAQLEALASEIGEDILEARRKGAGILYLLHGARSRCSTPMEYGGHFLEVDRKLLEQAEGCVRMVFIVGGADTFMDFVSDLPAEIFGWDLVGTGLAVGELRAMRAGLLAARSPEADIFLSYPGEISAVVEVPQVAHA